MVEKVLKGYTFRLYSNNMTREYKGKICYQIDTYYPSSQTCNRCGSINKDVKDLKVRKWECPNCTNINDRDIYASINIMREGIKTYMECRNNTELQVK